MEYSFVTFLTNDTYIPGLLALKRSLKKVRSKYPLTVVIPNNDLILKNTLLKKKIIDDGCRILTKEMPELETLNIGHYWDKTFFKIVAGKLTCFRKIILLDCDMLICKNIDHLFEKPNMSAVIAGKATHQEWEDLNSGLLVLEPNDNLYERLIFSANKVINQAKELNVPVGDQDAFIDCFYNWKKQSYLHLPEIYNCYFNDVLRVCASCNCKTKDIYIIHFIGPSKPWHFSFFSKQNLSRIRFLLLNRRFYQLKVFLRYLRLSK